MAHELTLRDTSRSYAVRAPSGPMPAMGAAALDGRCVLVHALLARVLSQLGAAAATGAAAEPMAVLERMPCTLLCFSTQRLPTSKFAELDRQLAGQQQGLNALTVEEYLSARARFDAHDRDPAIARRARACWRDTLMQARREALRRKGCKADDIEGQARRHADRTMRGMHALHNPDRVAGGRDVIGDFGDGQVNSTIGRQWNRARRGEPSRVQLLDCAAACVPETVRACTRMNGLLTRATATAPPSSPAVPAPAPAPARMTPAGTGRRMRVRSPDTCGES